MWYQNRASLTSFLLVPLLWCNIVMYVFYKVLNLGKFRQKVWQSELRSINGPGSQSVNDMIIHQTQVTICK